MDYVNVNGLLVPNLPDPIRWGSHLPLLAYYALITDGPILELGAGQWSTPFLHMIAKNTGRQLVSVESDPAYRDALAAEYGTDTHRFLSSYDDPAIDAGMWSLVLIDHERERRNADLQRLKDRAEYIIAHDTGVEPWYGYDFSTFRWYRYYTGLWGFSTVCTNTVNNPPYHASQATIAQRQAT